MLVFDIFSDPIQLIASGMVFLILCFATLLVRNLKIGKGLQMLLWALLLMFVTSLIQLNGELFYRYAVSAKVLALAEMLLILMILARS